MKLIRDLNLNRPSRTIIFVAFVIFINLVGCGVQELDGRESPLPPNPIPEKNIDPTIQKAIDSFIQDAEKYQVEIPFLERLRIAAFDSSKFTGRDRVVAECNKYLNSKKEYIIYSTIYVDPHKVKLDSCIFKQVIYHELGHCVLNYKHSSSDEEIMSSSVLEEGFCKQNWNQLVENLFKLPPPVVE